MEFVWFIYTKVKPGTKEDTYAVWIDNVCKIDNLTIDQLTPVRLGYEMHEKAKRDKKQEVSPFATRKLLDAMTKHGGKEG